MGTCAARNAGRSHGGFALRVIRADQFAAEQYRQELCIRYVSGPPPSSCRPSEVGGRGTFLTHPEASADPAVASSPQASLVSAPAAAWAQAVSPLVEECAAVARARLAAELAASPADAVLSDS